MEKTVLRKAGSEGLSMWRQQQCKGPVAETSVAYLRGRKLRQLERSEGEEKWWRNMKKLRDRAMRRN